MKPALGDNDDDAKLFIDELYLCRASLVSSKHVYTM